MKNFKKLIALALTVMMLVSALCVMSVHAEGDGRKFWVSHINKDDVFSNASVIFTEQFMKENNFKVLGDVTAAYKARMGAEIAKIDAAWNDVHTDHKFSQFFTLACQWNAENERYEIVTAVNGEKSSNVECPENGFILTMHADRDVNGQPPHNYPSTKFGEKNLGQPATPEYMSPAYWKTFVNQPVYLYNIDVEAATIITSGKFESKMSAEGLANGHVEVFENFSSESYITVGGVDSAASVAAFVPKNIKVSYASVKKQMDEYEKLDKFDWSDASWTALENVIAKYKTQFENEDQSLDQKTINAWANEIKDTIDALEAYDPNAEQPSAGTPGTPDSNPNSDTLTPGADPNQGTDPASTGMAWWIWALIAGGVLLVVGVVVILLVSKKKTPKTEEAKETSVDAEEGPKE